MKNLEHHTTNTPEALFVDNSSAPLCFNGILKSMKNSARLRATLLANEYNVPLTDKIIENELVDVFTESATYAGEFAGIVKCLLEDGFVVVSKRQSPMFGHQEEIRSRARTCVQVAVDFQAKCVDTIYEKNVVGEHAVVIRKR